MDQLVLKRDATWRDLGQLVKQGYDSGIRPVIIHCQEPEIPLLITLNQSVGDSNNRGAREIINDQLTRMAIPSGRFYVNPVSDRNGSFLNGLVYEPE